MNSVDGSLQRLPTIADLLGASGGSKAESSGSCNSSGGAHEAFADVLSTVSNHDGQADGSVSQSSDATSGARPAVRRAVLFAADSTEGGAPSNVMRARAEVAPGAGDALEGLGVGAVGTAGSEASLSLGAALASAAGSAQLHGVAPDASTFSSGGSTRASQAVVLDASLEAGGMDAGVGKFALAALRGGAAVGASQASPGSSTLSSEAYAAADAAPVPAADVDRIDWAKPSGAAAEANAASMARDASAKSTSAGPGPSPADAVAVPILGGSALAFAATAALADPAALPETAASDDSAKAVSTAALDAAASAASCSAALAPNAAASTLKLAPKPSRFNEDAKASKPAAAEVSFATDLSTPDAGPTATASPVGRLNAVSSLTQGSSSGQATIGFVDPANESEFGEQQASMFEAPSSPLKSPAQINVSVLGQQTHYPPVAALSPVEQIFDRISVQLNSTSLALSDAAASPQAGPSNLVKTLDLQLEPASLGRVTLRLRLVGTQLDVQVEVGNSRALQVIADDKDLLVGKLRDQGYSVNALVVRASDPQAALGASGFSASQGGGDQPASQTSSQGNPQATAQGATHNGGENGDGRSSANNERARPQAQHAEDVQGASGGVARNGLYV